MRELHVSRDSPSPDLQTPCVEDMVESDDSEDTFSDKSLGLPSPKKGRSLSDPGMFVGEDDVSDPVGDSEVDASHLQTEIPDDLPIEEQDRICDDLGELNQDAEPLRTESIITQDVRILVESSFEIDAVACEGVPMVHIVRVMCSFLLSGRAGEVLPDSNVRVSVKSLALSCIAQAVRHHPEGFLVGILPDHGDSGGLDQHNGQLVRDILLFNAHPDPQLRGCLASVLSLLIAAGLKKGR
jgi:huntingtin